MSSIRPNAFTWLRSRLFQWLAAVVGLLLVSGAVVEAGRRRSPSRQASGQVLALGPDRSPDRSPVRT